MKQPAGIVLRVRWENVHRWYEAEVVHDLLGDWVVVRRWGGKDSKRHGEMTCLVDDEADGLRLVEQIHVARSKRRPAYWLVY